MSEDKQTNPQNKRKSVSEDGKEPKEKTGCSFAKFKSYVKIFCAHLFSHVGLSGVVILYTIMGAFVFSYLEQGHEIATRAKVGSNRKDTLDQLYNITEIIRYKVIEQSVRIEELESALKALKAEKRKCTRLRRKEGKFLQAVIKQCKGDNVPLTVDECLAYCSDTKLKEGTCKEFCEAKQPPCTYWHSDTFRPPVISFVDLMNRTRRADDTSLSEDTEASNQTETIPTGDKSSDNELGENIRNARSVITELHESSTYPPVDHASKYRNAYPTIESDALIFRTPKTHITTEEIVLEDIENPPDTSTESAEINDVIPSPYVAESTSAPLFSSSTPSSSSFFTPAEARTDSLVIESTSLPLTSDPAEDNTTTPESSVVQPPPASRCVDVQCIDHSGTPTLHCLNLQWRSFAGEKVRPLIKQFNILWRANWTREAEKVLRVFERDVILKVKTEGYDGNDNQEVESASQWNFSGALLYSVTIITTIGYGNIAPKTKWGRIVTIIYATFGMPIFIMWVSNMGTLLAQTFTFLYANICCFVCRQGKKRKAMKKQQRKEERASRREKAKEAKEALEQGSPNQQAREPLLPICNQDAESGMYSIVPSNYSTRERDKMDPMVKNILSECARYNLDQCDDDPLSEQVVEEIRHADAMDIIRERSRNASPLVSPQKSPIASPASNRLSRSYREGSSYENSKPTPDRDSFPKISPRLSPRIDTSAPGSPFLEVRDKGNTLASLKREGGVSTSLLYPNNVPPSQTSPLIAPKAVQEGSPTSSKQVLQGDKGEPGSAPQPSSRTVDVPDLPPPIEKVPVLPVIVFIVGYIILGAIIFSTWENWTFLEGAYFSFITLTTIGFGDFVPGDAVLNADTKDGQYKLILACLYVLVGLAVISMTINLLQEEVIDMVINLAKDLGIIDDDDDEDDDD